MDYYTEIKNKLIDNEIYSKVKDYSKERNRVITYFETGKLLNDAGKSYGKDIIGEYSKRLQVEVDKKYTRSTLFRMRQFYLKFSNEKVAPVARQLSWSHYVELLSLKNYDEILYYINQCIELNLSRNKLREMIKNKDYNRLPEKTKLKLIKKEDNKIEDFIKNPIIIKNPNNIEVSQEKALHRLILEDIEDFMKELGSGFTFVGSEYKIRIGNTHNYIDILLYNIKYRCYIVIELKVTELKKEYIGQVEVYMNYIDNNLKSIEDDKTIGIIIRKKDNRYVIDYCSDKRILYKEYELV